MEILSLRDKTRGSATASYVSVDSEHECHGLEDAVREPVEGRPEGMDADKWVASWKIPGKTAMPTGRYQVLITWSRRFQKYMIQLINVPGFDGIRVHGGLRPEDTEGCILLGDAHHETPDGPRIKSGTTRPAVDRLFAKVDAALKRHEPVWWTVKENPNA